MQNELIKNLNPYEVANILSKLFFIWILPFLKFGANADLTLSDLYPVRREDQTKDLGDKLEIEWNTQIRNSRKLGKPPKLYRSLISIFWKPYLPVFCTLFISECTLRVFQPILFRLLIRSFEDGNELPIDSVYAEEQKYLFAGGLSLVTLTYALAYNLSIYNLFQIIMKCRAALSTLIYRKALLLSSRSQNQVSVGHLVNLMANDVNRLDNCIIFSPYIIIGPIQLGLLTYILLEQIGLPTLAGVGFLSLLLPLQYFIGKYTTIFRGEASKRTDERAKFMSEIIEGIRVIKMYAWEEPFSKLIQRLRTLEIKSLKKIAYLQACYLGMYNIAVKPVILITIGAYLLSGAGSGMRADQVFYAVAIFNTMLHTMLIYFPYAASGIGSAVVALRRIEEFLLLPEKESKLDFVQNVFAAPTKIKPSICLENICASWNSSKPTLRNINIDLSGNKLVVVVGSVGAGKSSFLNLLNSELAISSGKMNIRGTTSYASQEPWIFSGTIRENILMCREFSETMYSRVIDVCALKQDLYQFPYGDLTLVGERGVSLSGGQRARVNLARAIYQKSDIYLLDDPLSAVDTGVCNHIFEDCINSFLSESLRILVTHQQQYLAKADYIIVLGDGEVIAQGTYDEIRHLNLCALQIHEYPSGSDAIIDENGNADIGPAPAEIKATVEDTAPQQDSQEELMQYGNVSWTTYLKYLQASRSPCSTVLILFGFVVSQGIISSTDWWLSFWSSHEQQNSILCNELRNWNCTNISSASSPPDSDLTYLWIFMGLVAGTVLSVSVLIISFFRYSMKISANMHDSVFQSLVKAETKFFDQNPSGRILNRATRDLGAMDQLLPEILYDTIFISLKVIGSIVVVIISNYYILAPTLLVLIGYYWIRSYYVKTVRDLKRIEAISRSPLYTQLISTYQGLSTIRACKVQASLIKQFDAFHDVNNSANFLLMSATRWFAIWLEMITVLYFTAVIFSFLLISQYLPSGTVGLAIGAVMELNARLQWGMRQSAELENIMTSVERILEYRDIKSEAPWHLEEKREPNWIQNGEIQFKSVCLNYDEKAVLKNLNFTVCAQEKIGIVGRTGAGKSSIISALLRLTELSAGQIFIDGVCTSDIGIHDLRKCISIIPQEPHLFTGTMRYNLDPFNQFKDHEIWRAIEEVSMKDVVQDLDMQIESGGSNLSVGERQLICLARALLRNNRIIIMDEATASVDKMTDHFIQQYMKRNFASCTILTIAHRLDSILDCNRVLVLDNGGIVSPVTTEYPKGLTRYSIENMTLLLIFAGYFKPIEDLLRDFSKDQLQEEYDHPRVLLENPTGYLSSLIQQTDSSTQRSLYRLVEQNVERIEVGTTHL